MDLRAGLGVLKATWAVGGEWGVSASLQQDFGVAAWLLWGTTHPGESCTGAWECSHLYKLYKSSPCMRQCAHKYVDLGSSPHDLFTSSIILFLTLEQFLETVRSSN